MKFAAIYARSSLGRAKQGDTVEHQIAMIKEFALRYKLEVTFDERFIYEDDGESGFKTTLLQRPQMRRMLADIDNGLVDVIFFKGISRFARDSAESISTAKRLTQKGVRVISIEEGYDSFKSDPTIFQIHAVLAEQESRKTGTRVSLGNKQKARNGEWSGSITPIGYTKVKDIKDDKLRSKLLSDGRLPESLQPDNDAHIIKKIFNMYSYEGLGRKKIASNLNEKGYRTKLGNLFQDKSIRDILVNEAYIGNIVYGKTRYDYVDNDELDKKIQKVIEIPDDEQARKNAAHPAIVSQEAFELAQEKINRNRRKYNQGKNFNAAKHPLTGILMCGQCGRMMICQKRTNKNKDGTKKEYRYYVCSTYHRLGRHVCRQANVAADQLEEELLNFVFKKIEQYLDVDITKKVKEKDNQEKELQADVYKTDQMIQKKVDAVKHLLESRDIYDSETFISLNSQLQNEIKILRERKGELERLYENLGTKKITLSLNDLYQQFKKEIPKDITNRRRIFHRLLDSVVVAEKEVREINFIKTYDL